MCKFTKEKEIVEVFKKNTKDGLCAFVTLDFSKDLIPEQYIAIQNTDCNSQNNKSFTGFLLDRTKVKDYLEQNGYKLLLKVSKDIPDKEISALSQKRNNIDPNIVIPLEFHTF